MHLKFLCLCVACLISTSAFAQDRTWSDKSGKYSVKAELIKVDNQQVSLKKTSGKVVQLSIDKLSDEDRKFIKKWQAAQKKPTNDKAPASTDKKDWLADVKFNAKAKREAGFDHDFDSKDPLPEVAVEIEISGKAAAGAFAYGKLKINSLKDGAGNDLTVPKEEFGPDISKEMEKVGSRGDDFFDDHPTNGVRLKLKTIDKPGKVKMISEASGQIEVLTGGVSKKVTIKDVSSYKEGTVKSDVLKELGIKCTFKRDGDAVTLRVNGDVSGLASMQFLDSKGKEVKSTSWSSSGFGKSFQYRFDFKKIPAADWVLDFRVKPDTVTIPFEVKNIKVKTE